MLFRIVFAANVTAVSVTLIAFKSNDEQPFQEEEMRNERNVDQSLE